MYLLSPDAIAKLEADMNGIRRAAPRKPEGGDDYPHFAHLARSFPKCQALSEAQNHRCAYCGIRFSDDPEDDAYGTLEHVVPRIAGGLCIWSNEVMACWLCNQGRGAMWARQYFQRVVWMGREKAYRWGIKKAAKKHAARYAAHKLARAS